MDSRNTLDRISILFEQKFQHKPDAIEALPRSGSDRIYFRLKSKNLSVIGAFNPDIPENEAFFSFTETFRTIGIHVPEVLAIDSERQHYLLTDMGNETLYDRIRKPVLSPGERSPLCILKKSIRQLLKMQFEGARSIDFSKCYPVRSFDRQAVLWDLNYFKYMFLKLSGIAFNEQLLENDFQLLAGQSTSVSCEYFMYRDFQVRNIMIINNEPWFIDYQGGRKGPLHYDLASLLYSPKTGLNPIQRESLLVFYLEELKNYTPFDRGTFVQSYYTFVLIRVLQALGAYGFRGIFQGKPHFRNSISLALENLRSLFSQHLIPIELPEIERIILSIPKPEWSQRPVIPKNELTLRVTSFAYKNGIPPDPSGNGGGFVFDCRGLPNPGKLEEFRNNSGIDQPVIEYLERYAENEQFQNSIRKVVEPTISAYIDKRFSHLCIQFGCTGGQHRSVYHAEKFARWLKNNIPVKLVIIHTEKEKWNTNGEKEV